MHGIMGAWALGCKASQAGIEPQRSYMSHRRMRASRSPLLPRRIVKLVRALRKGWIKKEQAPEKPTAYLFWEDDGETGGRAIGCVAAAWQLLCGRYG